MLQCYILEQPVADTALVAGDELGLPSHTSRLPYAEPQHLFNTAAAGASYTSNIFVSFKAVLMGH